MIGANGRSTTAVPRLPDEGNEEIVRIAYVFGFDRRQPQTLIAGRVALLSRLDPEVEFTPDASDPTATMTKGPGGIAQLLEGAARLWESWRYDISELEEIQPGRVLAAGRVIARRRGHRATLDLPFANVWTLRDRRVIRIEAYPDRAAAVGALLTDHS
jgi:ketosteroid isomerase-like protein